MKPCRASPSVPVGAPKRANEAPTCSASPPSAGVVAGTPSAEVVWAAASPSAPHAATTRARTVTRASSLAHLLMYSSYLLFYAGTDRHTSQCRLAPAN